MNRIDQLFRDKQERVLSVYMTAGYPALEDTAETLLALQESGVDMVELGMPFSDPLADGEVIQQSSHVALENGMTIEHLFGQISQVRDQIHIPLVLMGYLNPVMQYGFEKFVGQCVACGIDGLILPDLPLEIYNGEYRKILEESGLKFIMLVTPYTSEDRVREIAAASGGFLYMVADASTTGAKKGITEKQLDYFQRIKLMNLSIPRLIGFGISSAESFSLVSDYAHGAIIGSAFIKAVGTSGNESVREKTGKFVKSILLSSQG